jgi:stress response protein SCP2
MQSLLVMRVVGAAGLSRTAKGATNLNLEIVLDGIVPQAVVSACNTALAALATSVLSLSQVLPILRYQDGYWTFVCACAAKFRMTILTEAFLIPLTGLGYVFDDTADRRVPTTIATPLKRLMSGGHGEVELCFVHADRAALGGTFRPAVAELEGGGGALVAFDWARSIEAAPGARFDVSAMARGGLVVGVGWDAMRNKTFEKLYGNGGGLPDLDVAVYTCNRWGEVVEKLSTKGKRKLLTPARVVAMLRANHEATYESAIKISTDSQGGGEVDDDELVAFNLSHVDASVCSILVCVELVSGARDFNYVKNLYCRLLDVTRDSMEIELCRFRAPPCPQDAKTAVMMRFERALPEATHAPEDACPPAAPVKLSWVLQTIGEYTIEANPTVPVMSPGDVVQELRIGHAPVPLCNSALSVGAVLQGGLFNANVDRIQDALEHCAPVTIKFATAGDGEKIEYECTFDTDPTKGMLTFKPQKLQWSSLSNLLGLSSAIGVPQVAAVSPAYAPRRTTDKLLPFTGTAAITRPDRVLLHGFKAVIGAKDSGGTTDAYCRVWYNTINTKAGLFAKENWEVEIARSDVLKKMPCPGFADWPGFRVVVPIESMVGTIPALIVTVRDKDWGVGAVVDDTILRQKIDLSTFQYVGKDPSECATNNFCVVPDWIDEINDVKSNRGFTKDQVTLLYSVTLLYPGQPAPDGVTGISPPKGASVAPSQQSGDGASATAADAGGAAEPKKKKKGLW